MENETRYNVSSNERPIIKDDEIDFIALAHVIWDKRKTIFYSIGVAIVIGLLVALLSPVKFSASATILPQTDEKNDLGGLSGLASMAGINISSMMGNNGGIQPDLYPKVIQSYPFLNELVHQPFQYEDEPEPVSIYDKMIKDTIPGLADYLIKFTIKLPWTIKNALMGKKDELGSDIESGPIKKLSKEEQRIFETMMERISVEVDQETGLVTISTEMEEPLLSAQVAQKTVELLQKYIIEYKTRQARNNLEFIQARYNEKKAEFEKARAAFFDYRNRNRNVVEERTDMRYQELSDAYNLAAQVYQNLAEQLEQAEIAVKQDTPAFSIIEPVKIPIEKSAPKRSLIMVVSIFLGGFLGIGVIFGQMMVRKFKEAW
ncbi:Wzz/FepE/Etk N-terminal domain-containing protein [Thermophagus xiamenensis]|uniref:G-rich domain on putative tyrosine kinase n=1 Tax=Thermophagus xiamenensis TaxID=385682 RepID=A0A1I2DP85_9BACT|nr:Wzz/FepE/Etk N-terminal domain-containing protein [Thermophagus xiamenensis]SFE82141.1 G-rich domain on putative tyrosine kinase [Thermophagus xiamenensis]